MRPSLIFGLAAFAALGCGGADVGSAPEAPETRKDEQPEPPPEPNALATAADALFTAAVDEGAFAGTVVVIDDGEIVLEKAYGLADRKAERANAVDTIFRLGSASKPLTAAAVLALAEDGALELDDPVAQHFPELLPENLEKDGVSATIHHILTPTSGIGDAKATEYFKKNAWFEVIEPDQLLAAAAELPMVSTPGINFAYSNWGYYLLGLVVERVSGLSYEVFLRERFFAPLGMDDSGTHLPAAKADRAALGYDEKGETMAGKAWFKDTQLSLVFGSGQIYATAGDLARWDRALASGAVLPKLGARLFTPALGGYAYGWVVEKKGSVDVQWHNGALAPLGFTSLLVRVPSKDRFVAYLANVGSGLVVPALEKKTIALAAE
jgi:CubicO group peptidase (beta-lactamase class C family)